MVSKNQVNRATRSGAMAIFQFSSLNLFQKFPETIKTLKEWFLSKKGPKEGERMREVTFMKEFFCLGAFFFCLGVKEWVKPPIGYLQALDLPQNLCSVSESGHMKISLSPNSIFI